MGVMITEDEWKKLSGTSNNDVDKENCKILGLGFFSWIKSILRKRPVEFQYSTDKIIDPPKRFNPITQDLHSSEKDAVEELGLQDHSVLKIKTNFSTEVDSFLVRMLNSMWDKIEINNATLNFYDDTLNIVIEVWISNYPYAYVSEATVIHRKDGTRKTVWKNKYPRIQTMLSFRKFEESLPGFKTSTIDNEGDSIAELEALLDSKTYYTEQKPKSKPSKKQKTYGMTEKEFNRLYDKLL